MMVTGETSTWNAVGTGLYSNIWKENRCGIYSICICAVVHWQVQFFYVIFFILQYFHVFLQTKQNLQECCLVQTVKELGGIGKS